MSFWEKPNSKNYHSLDSYSYLKGAGQGKDPTTKCPVMDSVWPLGQMWESMSEKSIGM